MPAGLAILEPVNPVTQLRVNRLRGTVAKGASSLLAPLRTADRGESTAQDVDFYSTMACNWPPSGKFFSSTEWPVGA